MRNKFFLCGKVLLIYFALFGTNVRAKTIYLSTLGNNTQSGLSENQAVSTLSKAVSLCTSGDEILVMGMIDLSKEAFDIDGLHLPVVDLKITGKDKATSGFSGATEAIWFSGETSITNCTFSRNKSYIGILNFIDVNFTLTNCIFKENEGSTLYITNDETEVTVKNNVHIESCSFLSNIAIGEGGGLFVDNYKAGKTLQLTIVNSTFYNNGSESRGGAMMFSSLQDGSSVDLINCTIVNNRVENVVAGGAGLYFNTGTENAVKRIYNCIIESNISTGSAGKSSDISFRYLPEEGKDFIVLNSYIGSFWDKSIGFDLTEKSNCTNYQLSELAELATPYDDYITSQNSIPLEYNASALYHGNPQYLKDLGISTDQNGNERKFENNKCAAGAIEKAALPPTGVEPQVFQQFIMYGQSLSTGHESYPVSIENIEGNYMIGEQIWINYGNKNFEKLTPLRAAKALGLFELSEVALHGTVNHIRLKQREDSPEIENKFIATSAGESGRSIEDLSKESQIHTFYSQFQAAIRYGKKIATKAYSEISVPAIFWLQGEWNYHEGQTDATGLTAGSKATNNKDEYKKLMIQLKNNMQEEIQERYLQDEKPLFITYQVGAQYTRGRQLSIGMAQLEASNEYKDVVCAGPVYPMTDFGGHLDGNGYRWYGEMMGKIYYKTKILGEDFRPLQPKKLARDPENTKKVYVTFHVPEPPLVLDINTLKQEVNYGFKLYLRGFPATIDKVEIVNDSVLAITSVKDLSTDRLDVSYGSSDTRGHGNLRDSDPYKAFFHYEFPDKKDENGIFVFDHSYDPINEIPAGGYGPRHRYSLIPPSGEPLGEDGKPIYDQPYPLYNFCVAFYYEIPKDSVEFIVPYFSGSDSNTAIHTIKSSDIEIYQSSKTLYVNIPTAADTYVKVYDISGKVLKQFADVRQEQKYSLQSLPSGVYIVKVSLERQIKTVKMIL